MSTVAVLVEKSKAGWERGLLLASAIPFAASLAWGNVKLVRRG
jgi:hypothetical protein